MNSETFRSEFSAKIDKMSLSYREIFLAQLLFLIVSLFILIPSDHLDLFEGMNGGFEVKQRFFIKPKNAYRRDAFHNISNGSHNQMICDSGTYRDLLKCKSMQLHMKHYFSEQTPIVDPSFSSPSDICKTKPLRGTNYTIIYNVMPKTGSRTLSTLSRQLLMKRFKSDPRLQRVELTPKDLTLRYNTTRLKGYYREASHEAVFIRGHNTFVPPLDSTFLCINTIREPISWMTSLYYFQENGDSSGSQKIIDRNRTGLTFDECISRDLPKCKPQIERYLRFFCGDDPVCKTPHALEKSKTNIDNFLFVGLTEEFEDTVRILEVLMPDLFKGLTMGYKRNVKRLKQDYKTVSKKKLWKKTEKILQQDPNVRVMYEFYEFVKDRFHRLKKCLL